MLLDAAGMFFDAADLLNAAWYAAEGNELMAMTCVVSAIPFMGSVAAGGTKVAFAGSKVMKTADKVADYIAGMSKLMGYTGQATMSAINTAYSYKDYKSAKANGTVTSADKLDVAVNALFTLGTGICALSAASKVTTMLRADGVGAKVKASAGECMSGKGGSDSARKYYQVTSKENAQILLNSDNPALKGTEFKEVYVWTEQPTLKQAKNSGARYLDTVIQFETNATFSRDTSIVDSSLWDIARVSDRPGPIPISNVVETGFKESKRWWQLWKK